MHHLFSRLGLGVDAVAALVAVSALLTIAPQASYAQAASGAAFTSLYNFGATGTDGKVPFGGLVQGADSNFYGTTSLGGTSDGADKGSVFKITPSGSLTSIYAFLNNGNDGTNPNAGLVLGASGSFYGTTQLGGVNSAGTVFQVTPSGSETVIHAFNEPVDGAYPECTLDMAANGDFYGVTSGNPTENDYGTFFQLTPSNALTTPYVFSSSATAPSSPEFGVAQGSDGSFYGVTSTGGQYGYGAVYKVTASGTAATLYSFSDQSDGGSPYGGLALGADGNFYGTTSDDGSNESGTVFKITPSGTLTTLYTFTPDNGGNADGSGPSTTLLLGTDGNFYGMTSFGGTSDDGVVFKITPTGTLTTLYSFTGGTDGANPFNNALVEGTDGALYGLVSSGGTSGYGTVFKLTVAGLSGTMLSTLTLNPTSVNGGSSSMATVKLSPAAPVGGAVVALSSNSSLAGVPAGVTIPAGATSATFAVQTSMVTSAHSATITATYNSVSKAASLAINPAPIVTLSSVTLNPGSVVGGQANATGTVILSGNALSATPVTLASSNGSVATAPSSVIIAAGANSASFTVTSKAVTLSSNVTITATLGSASKTAVLTVTPSGLKSVTLSPATIVGGASATANRVYYTGNAATNVVVSLKSSNTAVATVPSSVTISSGSSSHVFTITTQAVASTQTVTITATSNGVTQSANLTVTPAAGPAPASSTRFDFNRDGHADLIWYNTGSGALSVWDMNDSSTLSYGATFAQLAPSSCWVPVAAPDANGDGSPDLLWWNKNTGELSIWTLNNTAVTNYGADFATLSDTTWKPVAVADNQGSNWTLVFQNSATGNVSAWQMSGTTVTSYSGTLGSVGAGSGWQCVGAPDLNGDGHSDLLFWNSQTGEVSWWGCNLGAQQVLSYNADFAQVNDTTWHLQGSEDTNGDGHPDLIWWNASSGIESRWLLSGTTVTQYGGVSTQVNDTTWQPTAIR